MKHYILALLLLPVAGSYAQTFVRPGIRVGANFSQITRTYYEPRTDFYVGVFSEIRLSELFRIQPEFGYSRQGARGDVYKIPKTGSGETEKEWFRKDIESNYITLGATGKLAFTESARILFGISTEQGLELTKPLRNDVDFAVLAGAEYRFPFGLGVEIRMKRGLFDMIDSREYETFSRNGSLFIGDRNLNLVIQAGLNYTLNLRK